MVNQHFQPWQITTIVSPCVALHHLDHRPPCRWLTSPPWRGSFCAAHRRHRRLLAGRWQGAATRSRRAGRPGWRGAGDVGDLTRLRPWVFAQLHRVLEWLCCQCWILQLPDCCGRCGEYPKPTSSQSCPWTHRLGGCERISGTPPTCADLWWLMAVFLDNSHGAFGSKIDGWIPLKISWLHSALMRISNMSTATMTDCHRSWRRRCMWDTPWKCWSVDVWNQICHYHQGLSWLGTPNNTPCRVTYWGPSEGLVKTLHDIMGDDGLQNKLSNKWSHSTSKGHYGNVWLH